MKEKESWYVWTDIERDPAQNMAIDESLFLKIPGFSGTPLLRTYGWDSPSISIGRSQIYPDEYAKSHSIVRRISGGGIVFHGSDFTYSIFIPNGHKIFEMGRMDCYRILHHPVVSFYKKMGIDATLAKSSGMPADKSRMQCFVAPAQYDVVSKNGKLAGAAQRRGRAGILHQGSLKLDGISQSRVRILRNFIDAFESWFRVAFVKFPLDAELFSVADSLAETRYSSRSWNVSGEYN